MTETLHLPRPRRKDAKKKRTRFSKDEIRAMELRRPLMLEERRALAGAIERSIGFETLNSRAYQARQLPLDLLTTDRIMLRWAISIGDGFSEYRDNDRPTGLDVLDDHTAMVVDHTYMQMCYCPNARNASRREDIEHEYACPNPLLFGWYKTSLPIMVMSRRLDMTDDVLLMRWRSALHYLLEQFIATRHATLLRLLGV